MTNFVEDLANKIDLHLKLKESPGYFLSNEDLRTIVEALRFTARYDGPKPLIKGAIYQTVAGPAEFVGVDVFHGETSYEFVLDRRRKYVLPDKLASFLGRNAHSEGAKHD